MFSAAQYRFRFQFSITSHKLIAFSDQISSWQARVDGTYAALKDLVDERKLKLLERRELFQLLYEINDLEQWIAQKTVVASLMEDEKDFDQVLVSFPIKICE